ncbi:MAG: peptidylprolyl isomerase [Alphaproteobacteria bacterium]|nr:MAG: peptidylprolyl isomerase [Alphaproteobacteria bacterium]
MTKAKAGDTVRIHYTGSFSDGSQFDSSVGREPLEFTVGSGEIIPGLDREIEGMEVGQQKTVTIAADDAYGPHDPSRTQAVPRSEVPAHIPLDIGTQLQLSSPDGQSIVVTVAEVTDEHVILDANHPLAGKDLVFDVELVEIV